MWFTYVGSPLNQSHIHFFLPSLCFYSLGFLFIANFCLFACFFFYCYAGWGYIVAFTKVLTMYQIYYTWIHSLHHSPLSPHSWNGFKRYHFSFTFIWTQYFHYIHSPMPFWNDNTGRHQLVDIIIYFGGCLESTHS
jgi:hypothetical protein